VVTPKNKSSFNHWYPQISQTLGYINTDIFLAIPHIEEQQEIVRRVEKPRPCLALPAKPPERKLKGYC
jgi:hypothetical protein